MSAPDFAAPILGFRAWHATSRGELVPWSASAAGAWVKGINEARCLHDPRGRDHVPPGRSCSCGIYALTDWRDPRLYPNDQAVGAVAAWGQVEVHKTGFRAQFACVLALGLADGAPSVHRKMVQAAAEQYGVQVVPLADLAEFASAYAQPLEWTALDEATPSGPQLVPNAGPRLHDSDDLFGIACEEHLWLRIEDHRVVVGLTRQLADRVQIGSPVDLVAARLLRGDRLAGIGVGNDELRVAAPFSAWTVEPNPALARDPDLIRTDPEGAGWLARLTPSDWMTEGGLFAWGGRARGIYASVLAREGDEAFAGTRVEWLTRNAHVSSAEDVLAELRAARLRPRFGSEEEVRLRVVARLQRALARPDVATLVGRAGVRVGWRLREPAASFVLDLRPGGPAVRESAGAPDDSEIVLSARAEIADDYFAGRADLAALLRSGEVSATCGPARALAIESVIRSLHAAYASEGP